MAASARPPGDNDRPFVPWSDRHGRHSRHSRCTCESRIDSQRWSTSLHFLFLLVSTSVLCCSVLFCVVVWCCSVWRLAGSHQLARSPLSGPLLPLSLESIQIRSILCAQCMWAGQPIDRLVPERPRAVDLMDIVMSMIGTWRLAQTQRGDNSSSRLCCGYFLSAGDVCQPNGTTSGRA